MTLRRAHRLHTRTNSLYADWYIYADEAQVDVANNRSYVTVSMAIYCSPGYSFTSDGVSCGITGSADRSYGRTTWSGETTIATGSFWVNHDDKGEAAAHIFYWGNTTWGNGCSGDFWLGLTTIARASQPSINTWPNNSPDITAGVECTIHMNKKANFTHKVSYSFGNKSGVIATGVVDYCKWTPPTSLLDQISTVTVGYGNIFVETYSGSTKIGDTKTCNFTLHLPSNSNPTVGTITLTEQHAGVKAKDANITVQQISKKLVSVPVTAKYSTSIKSVVCDGVTLTNTNGTYTGYISNKSNGTYTVTATDNRGLQSTGTVKQTYYAYSKPYVTASLKRESDTSQNGELSISGTYSTILSNTVSMSIKRNDASSSSSVTPTLSNGNISFSKAYTDLYYTLSFSIAVTVTDSFGESVSTTAYLGVGQYAFAMIKQGVVLGPDSYLFDKQSAIRSVLDFFYPVGTIYTTEDKDFNPSTRWGGTWELIKDRMIIGAGNSYAVKSTGGESTHTLTLKEMPAHTHAVGGAPAVAPNGVSIPAWNVANVPDSGGNGGRYYPLEVVYSGGQQPHNNMPPYYSAYIWRRTA